MNKKYAQINENRQFLLATDYKIIKEFDCGTPACAELKAKRQEARDEINRLEAEIKLMDEEVIDEDFPL